MTLRLRTFGLFLGWTGLFCGGVASAQTVSADPSAAPASTAPADSAAPTPPVEAPPAPIAVSPPTRPARSLSRPVAAPQPAKGQSPARFLPIEADDVDYPKSGGFTSSVSAEGWLALRGSLGLSLREHHSMELYTTDNSLFTRGAGLGVDVWRFRRVLTLAVEADWGIEKAASIGVLGGDFRSWYTQQQVNLGLSLRYRLGRLHPALSLISPHVRAFGSIAATKQQLRDGATRMIYQTGYQSNGGAGVALGVTVRTPSWVSSPESAFPALSLAVRLEAGYGFMADPEFRLQPVDHSDHPIEVRGASFGSLELDAAFLRASLEFRI